MGRRFEVSDGDWEKIKDLLPARDDYSGRPADNRLFINAVMHVAKTGAAWRDLPARFGKWNTIYVRFRRWTLKGVWRQVFSRVSDKELKTLLIDSTAVRVHPHGAGAAKKRRPGELGHRTQPRRTDHKDPSGNRRVRTHTHLGFHRRQGFRRRPSAEPDGRPQPKRLVADKAYNADYLLAHLDAVGCEAVIPPKRNRKEQCEYDPNAYKGRNVIERTIRRLKEYKKVATRYEKTTPSFKALCCFAATFINLRLDVNTP